MIAALLIFCLPCLAVVAICRVSAKPLPNIFSAEPLIQPVSETDQQSGECSAPVALGIRLLDLNPKIIK
jgi:hypothetical protein